MNEAMKEFKALKSDESRWLYLLNNKDCGLVVQLDNDDTFVVDGDNESEDYAGFDDYIGWSDGVFTLLAAIGIKAEGV